MFRSTLRRLLGAAFAIAVVVCTTHVAAQSEYGFRVNQFRLAPSGSDGFTTLSAADQGHLRFGTAFSIDYNRRGLSERLSPVPENTAVSAPYPKQDVVNDEISSTFLLSIGIFDRIILFGGLTFDFMMQGASAANLLVPTADGGGVGDVQLGGRFRLVGDAGDFFQLAFQGVITVPLGEKIDSSQTYTGDHSATGIPELIFEFNTDRMRFLLNTGFRLRQIQEFGGLDIGHDWLWSAAALYPVIDDRLELIGELNGSTRLRQFFGKQQTPVEVSVGARYSFGPGLYIGGGLGAGLTKSVGSPAVRVFAMVGFTQQETDLEEIDETLSEEETSSDEGEDVADDVDVEEENADSDSVDSEGDTDDESSDEL
ncbi:MAG: transporter [Polyangiales bacterium]